MTELRNEPPHIFNRLVSRVRLIATMANCDDETRLAPLLDTVGVLVLVVDEGVDAPEDDEVEEAFVFDAVPVDEERA